LGNKDFYFKLLSRGSALKTNTRVTVAGYFKPKAQNEERTQEYTEFLLKNPYPQWWCLTEYGDKRCGGFSYPQERNRKDHGDR